MSVLIETSKGDIVIDLFTESCPKTTQNFLKLCQVKYFNHCIVHNVQSNFLLQTGDPTKTGKGGESIHGLLYGPQARFFDDEIVPGLKHKEKGVVGMASSGPNRNGSQFYITTAAGLHSLDGKHTVFGQVVERTDSISIFQEQRKTETDFMQELNPLFLKTERRRKVHDITQFGLGIAIAFERSNCFT